MPAQCTAAVQQETVLPPGQPNSTIAADYYGYTTTNVPVSGNVLSNDVDPQANALTVTPQVTTIPGKGLLVLIGSGAYTVTPEPGYVGPVNSRTRRATTVRRGPVPRRRSPGQSGAGVHRDPERLAALLPRCAADARRVRSAEARWRPLSVAPFPDERHACRALLSTGASARGRRPDS